VRLRALPTARPLAHAAPPGRTATPVPACFPKAVRATAAAACVLKLLHPHPTRSPSMNLVLKTSTGRVHGAMGR